MTQPTGIAPRTRSPFKRIQRQLSAELRISWTTPELLKVQSGAPKHFMIVQSTYQSTNKHISISVSRRQMESES